MWPDPDFEESEVRCEKILRQFKYGPKDKVTMDLLPVEAYMIECLRVVGQDGHTHNLALSLLVSQREYLRLKQGEKPMLHIATGVEAPVRPRRRNKAPELRLV